MLNLGLRSHLEVGYSSLVDWLVGITISWLATRKKFLISALVLKEKSLRPFLLIDIIIIIVINIIIPQPLPPSLSTSPYHNHYHLRCQHHHTITTTTIVINIIITQPLPPSLSTSSYHNHHHHHQDHHHSHHLLLLLLGNSLIYIQFQNTRDYHKKRTIIKYSTIPIYSIQPSGKLSLLLFIFVVIIVLFLRQPYQIYPKFTTTVLQSQHRSFYYQTIHKRPPPPSLPFQLASSV